jgi:hypothetical protein
VSATDQQVVAGRFGAEYMPVSGRDKIGVALNTLSLLPLNALRHPATKGTSGWYVWGGTELSADPAFFQSLHAEHLREYCPTLEPYLGLAPGWRVLLAPNQEEVWFDEKLLAV